MVCKISKLNITQLQIYYNIIIIEHLASLSHEGKLMVFHWSLSDTKSSQVSKTLLHILTDLYAVV